MRIGSGNVKRSKIDALRGFLVPSFTLFFTLLLLSGCGEKPSLIHFNGSTMGTWYSVKYTVDNKSATIPSLDIVKIE